MFGNSLPVFIAITVVIMGGAAVMTGRAVAETWRPVGQVFFYAFLLGLVDRFLIFALFEGELLSFPGFVVDTAVLTGISLLAYRMTRVAKMVTQYPWLYERSGLMSYREKPSSGHGS